MAELLAANQITIAKVLDGEKGADGEMSAEQIAQLNQASEDASQAKSDVANLEIGGRNLLPDTDFGDTSKKYIVPDGVVEGSGGEGGFQFTPTTQIESGIEYTLSLRMRGVANVNFYELNTGGNMAHLIARRADLSETDYKKISYTFVVRADRIFQQVYICTAWGLSATGDWFEIEPKSLKLEKGNRATDWTPAPEDVASKDELVSTDESIRQDVENNYYSHTELGQSLSFNETDGLIIKVPNSPYETRISNTQIEFRYQEQPVAYINGEILVIPKSMMLDEMMVGKNKWSWRIRDNGNLQLKWIG